MESSVIQNTSIDRKLWDQEYRGWKGNLEKSKFRDLIIFVFSGGLQDFAALYEGERQALYSTNLAGLMFGSNLPQLASMLYSSDELLDRVRKKITDKRCAPEQKKMVLNNLHDIAAALFLRGTYAMADHQHYKKIIDFIEENAPDAELQQQIDKNKEEIKTNESGEITTPAADLSIQTKDELLRAEYNGDLRASILLIGDKATSVDSKIIRAFAVITDDTQNIDSKDIDFCKMTVVSNKSRFLAMIKEKIYEKLFEKCLMVSKQPNQGFEDKNADMHHLCHHVLYNNQDLATPFFESNNSPVSLQAYKEFVGAYNAANAGRRRRDANPATSVGASAEVVVKKFEAEKGERGEAGLFAKAEKEKEKKTGFFAKALSGLGIFERKI